MVKSHDQIEDFDMLPLPLLEGAEGRPRAVVKRKTSVRAALAERHKYRQYTHSYRLKRHSKCPSHNRESRPPSHACEGESYPDAHEFAHSPIVVRNVPGRPPDELNGAEHKDAERAMTDDTDVPPDHNDLELGYNPPKPNALGHFRYSSNSTTNTTSNIANPNGDLLSAISTCRSTGARLVRKEIVKLGSLELLGSIDSYVQVNFSNYRQFYDRVGPIRLTSPLSQGLKSNHVEISLWNDAATQLISQNSSKRKVYNIYWLPKIFSNIALRAAIKFVEDCNIRDGRSIKREIECHLYMYQRFQAAAKNAQGSSLILQDDWPTVEVLGYYLDKKDPGQSTLITRKLTGRRAHTAGPDFFYIIRSENNSSFAKKITPIYEFNKLDWCITALNRIAQFGSVGIRHNDIKPDNIVLDVYFDQGVKKVDVKIIDLGAASMEFTKEFTGGTPWYESPEQKLLEYYTKKNRNSEMAHRVDIDTSSDAWGAGLSIVEVLTGKRVVDYIKQPYGIGLLNYTGIPYAGDDPDSGGQPAADASPEALWWNRDEYWEISPALWLAEAKRVLGLSCANCAAGPAPDAPNEQLNGDETMVKGFPEFYFCAACGRRYCADRENICKIVARYVFNSLVVIDPRRRRTVQDVANQLRLFVTQAISFFL